ncbi:hypothetical protein D9M72_243070 [compost metagenome]
MPFTAMERAPSMARVPLASMRMSPTVSPVRPALSSSVPRARPSFWPGSPPTRASVPWRRSMREPEASVSCPSFDVSSTIARFGESMIWPWLSTRSVRPCASSTALPASVRLCFAARLMRPTRSPLASMVPVTVRLPLSSDTFTSPAFRPSPMTRSPWRSWKLRAPNTPPSFSRWLSAANSASPSCRARTSTLPAANGTRVPPAS